jgi:hypothetical protein
MLSQLWYAISACAIYCYVWDATNVCLGKDNAQKRSQKGNLLISS